MARKWSPVIVCLALVFAIAVPTTFSQFEFPQLGGASGGEEINFGDVSVGQTRTAQYTFKVLATSETSAQVTIYDPCSPFGFSGLASRSMVLQPGQSITFGVTFTPPQAQAYTCSFVIRAAGGYPVQETETVVWLSGSGVTGAGTPPETPGATVLGLPIGPPFTETPAAEIAEGIGETTDSDGKFEVAIPPASTVTGRLTECGGLLIADREFRVTPAADGYEIAVSGFEPVIAQPVSKISLFGMESIDLGEICLEPVAQTAAPTVAHRCQITHEWIVKTPIVIEDPLDYVPKQPVMPLGAPIAFHVRASDEDVLKQVCHGCGGEAVKRIGPLPDIATYTWDLAGDRAGMIPFANHGEALLYTLPSTVRPGESFEDILSCTVDDKSWPDHKADDDPVTVKAKIRIAYEDEKTCRIQIERVVPQQASYDVDVAERSAEDCNPITEKWDLERPIRAAPISPICMCPGQLYLIEAILGNPQDLDTLILKCTSEDCGDVEEAVACEDPLTLAWDDNGAGGSFPFGNVGQCVIYRAPTQGKEIRFTCSIDDSGRQGDDSPITEEDSSMALEIVRVVADDPRTHEIPSVLSASSFPRQHFVTVAHSVSGQDEMRLRAEILPNNDRARRCISWQGATPDPADPLVACIPRTAPRKQPVTICVDGRICKRLTAWVVWCTMTAELSTIGQTCAPDSKDPNYSKLEVELNTPRGVSGSGAARSGIRWTATVQPIEIITDADRPNLQGPNQTAPPGTTNWNGVSLQNGATSMWDISRQIRTQVRKNGVVMTQAELAPYFRYGVKTAPRDSIASYPSDDRAGNDDIYPGDETNNPYSSSPVGQLTSTDSPGRNFHNIVGSTADQIEFALHFREFVRVELDGNWYRCSDWGLWRFHISCTKNATGTCRWQENQTRKHTHTLNNDDWK